MSCRGLCGRLCHLACARRDGSWIQVSCGGCCPAPLDSARRVQLDDVSREHDSGPPNIAAALTECRNSHLEVPLAVPPSAGSRSVPPPLRTKAPAQGTHGVGGAHPTRVRTKPKRPDGSSKLIRGSANSTNPNTLPDVQPAKLCRVRRLFVTYVSPDTTAAMMLDSIRKWGIPVVKVLRLTPQSISYSSFCILVPTEHFDDLANPGRWSEELGLKEYYRHPRKEQIAEWAPIL